MDLEDLGALLQWASDASASGAGGLAGGALHNILSKSDKLTDEQVQSVTNAKVEAGEWDKIARILDQERHHNKQLRVIQNG